MTTALNPLHLQTLLSPVPQWLVPLSRGTKKTFSPSSQSRVFVAYTTTCARAAFVLLFDFALFLLFFVCCTCVSAYLRGVEQRGKIAHDLVPIAGLPHSSLKIAGCVSSACNLGRFCVIGCRVSSSLYSS